MWNVCAQGVLVTIVAEVESMASKQIAHSIDDCQRAAQKVPRDSSTTHAASVPPIVTRKRYYRSEVNWAYKLLTWEGLPHDHVHVGARPARSRPHRTSSRDWVTDARTEWRVLQNM